MGEKIIKQTYNELAKKHSLPDFDSINDEFEISSIEKGDFLLREIRRKIKEKIDAYAKILETLLQPDTSSLSSMYECKYVNDDEKKKIYDIYKQMMVIDRQSLVVSLGSEKDNADFIKNTFRQWSKLKKQIKPVIERIKSTWKKETNIKEELGYLG